MISLQKNPERDFIVLNLSDPHLDKGYLEQGHKDCRFLFQTIDRLITEAKPDLITISGDFGYGDRPEYLTTCRYFGDFLENYQIPWAIVWGNHDNQGGNEIIQKTAEVLRECPHFLYETGDEELGHGNYVISIEENGKVVEAIMMMDTHDRLPRAEGSTFDVWSMLMPPQLAWYEQQIGLLRDAGCENSVLITHIPIYAYHQAFEAAFRQDLDYKKVTVAEGYHSECWNEGYKDSFGIRHEEICSCPEDEGAFDVIQRLHHTKVTLCGHDHSNCFVINYKGVRLAYSLKTGRGGYYDKHMNGGTLLKIHSDGTVDIQHLFADPEESI